MATTRSRLKKTMTKAIQRTTTKQTARGTAATLRYVVLDSEDHWLDEFGRDKTVVCDSRTTVLKAIERTTPDSLWISRRAARTEELARTLVDLISDRSHRRSSFGNLLTLEAAKVRTLPVLEQLFGRVIGASRQFKRLPVGQLTRVLSAPLDQRRDVFIGGFLDPELETLVLVRGDLERVMAPLSIFRPSGRAAPDFGKFHLGDYGRTLRFGAYEATADIVLWETDPDYRKRAKARERAHAKGFGPSLRRLRKQRNLSQSDFPGVARKTISRIEKGEVEKPHGTTLNRIAKTLGVAPGEIETY